MLYFRVVAAKLEDPPPLLSFCFWTGMHCTAVQFQQLQGGTVAVRAQEDVMSFLHIGSWGRQHVFCLGLKWSGDPPTEFTKNPRWGVSWREGEGNVPPAERRRSSRKALSVCCLQF